MDLLSEGDKPSSQQPQAPANHLSGPVPTTDTGARVEALIAALKAAGTDITADYNDWLKVGFALAGEFGESGRGYFHAISSLYPG
ncbi:MAG: PriCT-2 domain-containing protein, partial [Bacteroidales bacterium]|nr:PriCT-2 domain-containing protein [Bacteroidales bacterium]